MPERLHREFVRLDVRASNLLDPVAHVLAVRKSSVALFNARVLRVSGIGENIAPKYSNSSASKAAAGATRVLPGDEEDNFDWAGEDVQGGN